MAQSLYRQASLIMNPYGAKDDLLPSIKPTDGSGDFTFSRDGAGASPATRVNASGLIEKGRENVILQSNQFDTTWGLGGGTLTSGQTGYDGSSDAWLFTYTIGAAIVNQTNTFSGVQTFSVYAKGNVSNGLRLYAFGSVNHFAYFDLNIGAVESTSAVIDAKIEDKGNGWYRCSVTYDQTNTQLYMYLSNNQNSNAGSGSILIQDAQLEQGLIATDVIETTTAPVSAGLLGDMPRLDYSGGATCPSLLLEPSRTNIVTQSEYFDSWTQSLGSAISNNSVISPEGVQNGSTLSFANNVQSRIYQVGLYGSATYVMSIYAKSSTGKQFRFKISDGVTDAFSSDITTTNEWVRYDFEYTGSLSNWGITNDSSANIGSIDIYGAQLESGSYPTSYIPTYGSASTRGADSCSKTGISSLIGQTEGTLFVELNKDFAEASERYIAIGDGTTANRIMIIGGTGGSIRGFISNSSVVQFDNSTGSAVGNHKIALAYANNDIAFYVDGVQIALDTSATIPAVSNLYLGMHEVGLTERLNGGAKQALLFKTRLTNAELAALTA